ncbi:UDP-glucose/GDP-mannose dehydrogenase family protein [candidate division WOR-3 bacterium]|nr:UDP-glucose/GDP-mannose dehydrogenase family protein [candidate division WOR-3 bacterium]
MKIAMIGTGYVGLVTGTCFSELGNDVICVDNDIEKIKKLNKEIIPIYEPGLEEMVKKNRNEKRLSFTSEIEDAVKESEIIFIAVGTPPKENGEADLSSVEKVSAVVADVMTDYKLVVGKSTVPVNTGKWIKKTINIRNARGIDFDVASNPEFLREGSAINDFLFPDRIVIGVESERAKNILCELYKPVDAPILVTDIESAEIIKHASNSFLATKISFINAISIICERAGADVEMVAKGMGLDKRIGKDFLKAGAGFGGFCFPKDLSAFIRIAENLGYDFRLLKEVERINDEQKKLIVKKIKENLWNLNGKSVGILGLSFKPDTDDIRYAPSIDIIGELLQEGVKIKAYDPKAMERMKVIIPGITYCKDPYEVCEDSDALVVLTEWDEFKNLKVKKIKKLLRTPILIDGRNIFDPKSIEDEGFIYSGVGRK